MRQIQYLHIFLFLALASCNDSSIFPASNSADSGSTSRGGSTAKFAIKDAYLYIVDDQHLSVFNIENESESVLLSKSEVGWGIETIFPYENLLLLGTQSGVLIFDISQPEYPIYISNYQHIVACDPVVTDGDFAYLTLRTGTNCRRAVNELHIIDMSDIRNPILINSVQMQNPKGLAIEGNTLFVCDGGIKVFDVSNKNNPTLTEHIKHVPANDVIYHRNQLLVTADNGFYQFDASNFSQLSFFNY